MFLLLLSGCQNFQDSSTAANARPTLGNHYWALVELAGKPVTASANQSPPHLIFLESEQRIAGSTGCNRLMGAYDILADGSLRLGNVATTMMACPDMATEAAFLKVLREFTQSEQTGDSLLFLNASGEPLARLKAQALPSQE